ncbi:MAG: response regulator transcription factor [Eubacterium sp.]|nr:response regulator transcription factor [Eubacterium sp.]
MKNILIIDDDRDLSGILSDMLEDYGYHTAVAGDGEEALEMLAKQTFHLIILDINLPGQTGFDLCRELRETSTVPVLFSSARTSETDRITGFDLGGDDYLPKPYSMKELLSRVKALIRRTYGFLQEERTCSFGGITVNLTARRVTREGEEVSLSLREFDLLAFLCEHKNTALSKETLLTGIWGAFSLVEPSTLTVHIRWLREKLEKDPSRPQFIKTVYKVGYILEVPL